MQQPTIPFVSPADRRSSQGVKAQIYGPAKIGKTSLALTCDPSTTIFLDCEKGMQSIREWEGKSVEMSTWEEVRNFTCFFSGPDHGVFDDTECYGHAHYRACCNIYGDPDQLSGYRTVFIDSTTIISQWAFTWCLSRPEAYNKSGARDLLGAYGLLARQLTSWAWRLQNTPRLNVILIGGIKQDEAAQWIPMVDGGAALKFPYIFDLISTMYSVPGPPPMVDAGSSAVQEKVRALVCQNPNPWNVPAGSRFKSLAMLEKPHIEGLIAKVLQYG